MRADLPPTGIFSRTNLVAWCIVPFDARRRGPEERAAMLETLGIRRLAYDWRSEHLPTFDDEVAALRRHGIELTAWWFPADLNAEARAILACLDRHDLHPQLWVTMGTEPEPDPVRLRGRIDAAAATLAPICAAAARRGSTVGLYNHLGWFGEPTNQLAVIGRLREAGHTNVGCVYNFHHGHAHIDSFAAQLGLLKPHLLAVNLNGMVWDGDRTGRKILPLGQGDEELNLLRILHASGWSGPVGILGHTEEDAEVKLRKELAGLERLAPLATAPPAPARSPGRKRADAPGDPGVRSALPPAGESGVPGRFGMALDARVNGLVVEGAPDFRQLPFTVDAWVRLDRRDRFNIVVASEAKSSPTHWELYTYAGEGDLSFFSPGQTPAEVRSHIDVCDGEWHRVSAVVESGRVRLWVDGRGVADQEVRRSHVAGKDAAAFAVGRLVEGGLGCDGWIDEVQVRTGVRVPADPASTRPLPDPSTVALWSMETPADRSPAIPAGLSWVGQVNPVADSPPVTAARATGEPATSGRDPAIQREEDWVDARWQSTEVGSWLASNVPLPGGTVAKGLTVRVGREEEGSVTYDTATGALRAWWLGGFLQFDPGRYGLIAAPRPAGTNLWELPPIPGWAGAAYRFRGWHRHGQRLVLRHEVGGTVVLESPWLEWRGTPVLRRSFEIDPAQTALTVVVGNAGGDARMTVTPEPSGRTRVVGIVDGVRREIVVRGASVRLRADDAGTVFCDLEPSAERRRFDVFLWSGRDGASEAFRRTLEAVGDSPDLGALTREAPGRFVGRFHTRGIRGDDRGPFAVDTLTLPYDNPYRALLFCTGVGFTADGAGYVSTLHGDVWRVTGVDDDLDDLTWQRFATGLFQPLGLQVRDGSVYVLGRDRITRLDDRNGDGEADFYESFHDGIDTSTGGHDYVTSLEMDDAGNFYYVDPRGAHRVSADGRRQDTLATGFRNPNGMGVRPDGKVVTVAPQQGTWTPSSGIWELTPGLYGGYGGPRTGAGRPLGYDPPLCWIPHLVDNSSGSQVWVPAGAWGPLGGGMLHLLWGRCGMMWVMRDPAGSDHAAQGAVVPLPVRFLSGPNRGVFRKADGHLYIAGSTGWQTSAVKDGCLQRVRFTGKPLRMPVTWHAVRDGVELTFAEAVDPGTASDPGSYAAYQWNYRYSGDYGSARWSVARPDREGRDDVVIRSARVLEDGRTVRLEIPGLAPVMQMELKYNVDGLDRRAIRGSLWLTLHQVGD